MLLIYLSALETDIEKKTMEKIYNEYRFMMMGYAMKILKNQAQAEDAIHNAFIAMINNKEKIFSLTGKDLTVQIVIITKNKCIDILRKDTKVTMLDLDDIAYTVESNDKSVEDQIVFLEEYQVIKDCISRLDETSRLVLQMKYVQGLSYKDIGEKLSLTPKHVDTIIARAKSKVRKQVGRGGDKNE